MLLCGGFVTSLIEQDSTTHPAGIVSYDPESNTFANTFNGGVYSSTYYLSKLESTPK